MGTNNKEPKEKKTIEVCNLVPGQFFEIPNLEYHFRKLQVEAHTASATRVKGFEVVEDFDMIEREISRSWRLLANHYISRKTEVIPLSLEEVNARNAERLEIWEKVDEEYAKEPEGGRW